MLEKKYTDLYAKNSKISFIVAEKDIILTYVIEILKRQNLLKRMIFKGGACLRKCYLGSETRFSLDLDFNIIGNKGPDDIILEIESIFNKTYFDIFFKVDKEDIYVSSNKLSCGANINYKHSWHEGSFTLNLSLREESILPIVSKSLIYQSFFKNLEFQPGNVDCFRFEELVAEKVRAAYQRVRARDIDDIVICAKKPINKEVLRTLVVIKCWNVRDPFHPGKFLKKITTSKYNWYDIKSLLSQDSIIDKEDLIKKCLRDYNFLTDLTKDEEILINDSKKHNQIILKKKIENELLKKLKKD